MRAKLLKTEKDREYQWNRKLILWKRFEKNHKYLALLTKIKPKISTSGTIEGLSCNFTNIISNKRIQKENQKLPHP